MTRAEERRRKKGIYPCMGCGHRKKLSMMESGFCRKCATKYKLLAGQYGLPEPVAARLP